MCLSHRAAGESREGIPWNLPQSFEEIRLGLIEKRLKRLRGRASFNIRRQERASNGQRDIRQREFCQWSSWCHQPSREAPQRAGADQLVGDR